jgi:prepilin-type N-terminal cleavage/methylation domain-containing protein
MLRRSRPRPPNFMLPNFQNARYTLGMRSPARWFQPFSFSLRGVDSTEPEAAFQRFRFSAFSTNNREQITNNCAKAGGFTLVELTAVILIIAILAGVIFTGASSMLQRAKKTQAKNDLTQLVTAINAFYTEYGQYPVAAQTGADSADYVGGNDANGAAVMDTLRVPTPSSPPALNPRGIVFLNVPVAKSTTKPLGGIGTTIRAWYDPWGSAYRIKIDNNYNGLLTNPYSDTDGSAGGTTLNQGVIAYSYGKNGALGGGAAVSGFSAESGTAGKFKNSSDVLSWQ